MNNPAWGSVMAESVPRHDLVQAITLNGIGFNLARAVGPALAGVLVLAGGPALAFGLNAVSYLAVIIALLSWHRRKRVPALPREHLGGAMRAGIRFVRHTPIMRAAILRTTCFFFAGAAPTPKTVISEMTSAARTGCFIGWASWSRLLQFMHHKRSGCHDLSLLWSVKQNFTDLVPSERISHFHDPGIFGRPKVCDFDVAFFYARFGASRRRHR